MTTSPQLQNLRLDDILRLCELGAFGLPDFQRSFIWQPDSVRDLLATVFKGWPAGLILVMEAPPTEFFSTRPVEGAPHPTSGVFEFLILDGQQRITALAQAFGITTDVIGPQWYVDVDKYNSGIQSGDIEDAFVRRQGELTPSDADSLIPLYALRNSSSFQIWRDNAIGSFINEPDSDKFNRRARINQLWSSVLQGAHKFEFPCSILPSSMSLRDVSKIFERLNTAGLHLDTFDLVVAHVVKDGHDLRNVWEEELSLRPTLRHFAPRDPLIAAQLISMVSRSDTRRAGLLNLDGDLMWRLWPRAIQALEDSANFLSQHAGVATQSQLPHRGLLLALAGAAYELRGFDERHNGLLLYWFYSRGLTEKFNAAVNTRVVSEYKLLVRALRSKMRPTIPIDAGTLREATRRGNASVHLTVQAMIRRNRAVDYPGGLFAIPISKEWGRSVDILEATDPLLATRAMGLILGSPQTEGLLRHRTLEAIFSDLESLDKEQVDEFLSTQILPPMRKVWHEGEDFLTARVAQVLDVLGTLGHSHDQGTPPLAGPPSYGASARQVQNWLFESGEFVSDTTRLRVGAQAAESLMNSGLIHEAILTLRILRQSHEDWELSERAQLALLESRILQSGGQIEASVEVLRVAIEAFPLDFSDAENLMVRSQLLVALGSSLVRAGRLPEGLPLLTDFMKSRLLDQMSPREVLEVSTHVAEIFAEAGEREKSLDIINTLTENSSGSDSPLANRALRLRLELDDTL